MYVEKCEPQLQSTSLTSGSDNKTKYQRTEVLAPKNTPRSKKSKNVSTANDGTANQSKTTSAREAGHGCLRNEMLLRQFHFST